MAEINRFGIWLSLVPSCPLSLPHRCILAALLRLEDGDTCALRNKWWLYPGPQSRVEVQNYFLLLLKEGKGHLNCHICWLCAKFQWQLSLKAILSSPSLPRTWAIKAPVLPSPSVIVRSWTAAHNCSWHTAETGRVLSQSRVPREGPNGYLGSIKPAFKANLTQMLTVPICPPTSHNVPSPLYKQKLHQIRFLFKNCDSFLWFSYCYVILCEFRNSLNDVIS